MKVCGISIAYNALGYGYPIESSLRSMLPLVDELILNAGAEDQGVSFPVGPQPAGRW